MRMHLDKQCLIPREDGLRGLEQHHSCSIFEGPNAADAGILESALGEMIDMDVDRNNGCRILALGIFRLRTNFLGFENEI